MKEEIVEWCIWFSLVHTFIVSHTVSSLVLEALGEDGVPVFPGPGNELSRITSPN